MSADNVHLKIVKFFRGLKPEPVDFLNLLEPVKEALARVQKRFASEDARPMAIPAITLPGAFQVVISAGTSGNAGVAADGYSVDWDLDLIFDATVATAGDSIGSTAPGTGAKRYVVLAVRHKVVGSDPRTDKEGKTVYYDQTSTTQKLVYQTAADNLLLDDYTNNAALIALVDSITADGSIPLAICEYKDGASDFLVQDVHPNQRAIYTAGGPASEADTHREFFGYTVLATVMTVDGKVSANPITVQGAPGRVDISGGETVMLTIPELGPTGEFRKTRTIRTIVPATSLNFLVENEQYVVRAKWNEGAQSLEVYQGTGDYPNDSVISQPFQEGSSGGSNQGFRRTLVDLPLAQVNTGLNGSQPTIQLLQNQVLVEDADMFNRIATLESAITVTSYMTLAAQVGSFTFPNDLQSFLEEFEAGAMLNSPSEDGDLNTLETQSHLTVGGNINNNSGFSILYGNIGLFSNSLTAANLNTGGEVNADGKITSQTDIEALSEIIGDLLVARTGIVIRAGASASQEFRSLNTCRAWAHVDESGGSYNVDAAFGILTGGTNPPINKLGTGVVEVFLQEPMSNLDYVVMVTARGGFATIANATIESTTKFTVRLFDTAGAASDEAFMLTVFGPKV